MLRAVLGTIFLSSLTAIADPPLTPAQLAAAEKNQDYRRTTAIETMRADLQKIEERRAAAAKEYEAQLKKLADAREELRATHAKATVEAAARLKALDDAFQAKMNGLRDRRAKVQENNAAKVAELDRELKGIQDRAREQYTEEVSKELKDHDEKRKAQEASRKSSLEALEEERVTALNGYFDSLGAHEIGVQKETRAMDTAKATQLAEQAKQTEEITQKYNDQLAALSEERAKLIQKSTDQLYGHLEVPSRTVPPVLTANGGSAGILSSLPKGQTIEMAITYGNTAYDANAPEAAPVQEAINLALAGKYAAGFSFGEKGELLFNAKTLLVHFVYVVDGVRLPLSDQDALKLEQRLLSAIVQNLYRVPTEDFKAYLYQPVDKNGNVFTYRQGPKIPAAVKAIMGDRKDELSGVTSVDDKTIAVDGLEVRMKWFLVNGPDGKPVALDATKPNELAAVEAKWAKAVKRSLTPVSVPREVRAKLALAPETTASASLLAVTLQAPARCQNYLFLKQGERLVIARRKDKAILFTATGLKELDGVACAEDAFLFLATGVRRGVGKFDLVKNPGVDIKVADLVATDQELTSKENSPVLFAVAGDAVRMGIVSQEGALAKVSTLVKDGKATGFRAWARDDKKEWITDFTLALSLDGTSAAPDLGSKPDAVAELSVEAIK